jgi:hypothetical protein
MASEIIFYIEESLDGGYEARALGYDIFTDGESEEELKKNVRDAVLCHFEDGKAPQIIKLHYVREEALAL